MFSVIYSVEGKNEGYLASVDVPTESLLAA
jgi:hypothetical protein